MRERLEEAEKSDQVAHGWGWEFIFTSYHHDTLPKFAYPDSGWPFGQSGVAGGRTWGGTMPLQTEEKPYIFVSKRAYIGNPQEGTPIEDEWSEPCVLYPIEEGAW